MQDIPRLGLGTWQLVGEECERVVQTALSVGYTHIDTAQIYGNEEEVGRGVRDYLAESKKTREDLRITTKVRIDYYDRVENSLTASLHRLKMDYVDLVLLHRPINERVHEPCLDALMQLQESGKIRHFGVSNFTFAQLEHAWEYTGGKIFTNQVEYHPCLSQEKLKAFADEKCMKITAYSPLGHGNLLKNQELQLLATKHGVSVAQVCIAWLLQQGRIVIPKASSKERLQENFDAQTFMLDEEALELIAQLPKHHRYVSPPFAPEWD